MKGIFENKREKNLVVLVEYSFDSYNRDEVRYKDSIHEFLSLLHDQGNTLKYRLFHARFHYGKLDL